MFSIFLSESIYLSTYLSTYLPSYISVQMQRHHVNSRIHSLKSAPLWRLCSNDTVDLTDLGVRLPEMMSIGENSTHLIANL